ncbi:probable LRR receptor-like serine/threonine-protein kinase At2g16250 [Ananas comosus]|uniref:Probable LRR receptor-like serine/threonine-protein kinase At2g16250 n=1 Tax=Ananas comosus TaxID=4615 RepID=A0A6P5EJJ5_ANACO|nr:probable LRR receptor-like serine/threonine-protein kinase At2g16250 [Ananas comosus]
MARRHRLMLRAAPRITVRSLLLVVVVAAVVGAASVPAPTSGQKRLSSVADFAGLYALRGSLGLRARDWPRHADPCASWTGVGCDRAGRVVSLNLSGLRRTRLGRLSARFAVDGLRNLSRLAAFNSTGFALPGPIPAWLGPALAPSLSLLDLSSSSVSGPLPPSLSALSLLQTLTLAHNNLSGPIPQTLWSSPLPHLRLLDLSDNNLTGSLPPNLNLTLTLANAGAVLNLSDNFYYGSIPAGFRRLFSLFSSVDISGNYFDGAFPIGTDSKNVSFRSNCFIGAPDQRSLADCEKFYADRGIPFTGPPATPPAAPLLPPPPAPGSSSKKHHKKLKYILIGVAGGVLVLLLVISAVAVVCCCVKFGARKTGQGEGGGGEAAVAPSGPEPPGGNGGSSGGARPGAVSVNLAAVGDKFTYDQLVRATLQFDSANLIKHGHSGDLYSGFLENGDRVVVKRIDVRAARKESYMAELDLFSKGLHPRLVPFLGHCLDDGNEKFLVYRFVPNGDLSNALHRKSGDEEEEEEEEEGMQSLDWIKRLKIAIGVAEALCYLHHECNPPMVHRDVQASSVLLDDKFEVRLGSLSGVCPQEGESHQSVITKLLRLSPVPEQSTSGSPPTWAYDVYCFGKVLLELVTGKFGISASKSDDAATNEWLGRILPYVNINEKELITKIIDPSLIVDEDHLEEVWAVSIVAMSCLNPKPSKRPPVKYILKALENPLKVVREDNNNSSSGRLRGGAASSSRGSWNIAFLGSWRRSSSDVAAATAAAGSSREDHRRLKRSGTMVSQGSNGGEHSLSQRRQSKEIFPDPAGLSDIED